MDFDVSVCIGTFGAHSWMKMAEKAAASVPAGIPVHHAHEATLAMARNGALAKAKSEWVIHLDADDELDPGYIEAMARGTADLRGPSLQRVRHGHDFGDPYVPRVWSHEHDCVGECLRYGNFLVIGTCARTELLRSVGGWEEFEWSEDWALWARSWKAGGMVETIPAAIYRAQWRLQSRNRIGRATSLRWHQEIEKAVWPEEASVL